MQIIQFAFLIGTLLIVCKADRHMEELPFVLVNSLSNSSFISRFTFVLAIVERIFDLPRTKETWRKDVINTSNSSQKASWKKVYLQRSNFLSDGSLYFFSMEARLLTSALLKQSATETGALL
jgi:hypothetical protein